MSSKTRVALVLLPAVLCGALLAAWLWRDALARAVINTLLAQQPYSVIAVQALRLGADSVDVGRVELLLRDSGRRLVLTDMVLGYSRDGFFALPVAETLALGRVQLETGTGVATATASSATATGAGGITPAALLALLRNFPLHSIALPEVWLPGRALPLSLQLQAGAGELDAVVHSGTLEVTGSFRQLEETAAAQATLQVRDGPDTAGYLELVLAPGIDPATFAGSGSFSLDGSWQQQALALAGELAVPPCVIHALASCSLQFGGRASLAAYTVNAGTMLEDLGFKGSGTVGLANAVLQLALEPGYTVTTASLQTAAIQVGGLSLTGTAPLALQSSLTTAAFSIEAAALSGSVDRIAVGEWSLATPFELRELRLTSATETTVAVQVETRGMVVSGPQEWLPTFDVEASLALMGERLEFRTPLRLAGVADSGLQVQGSHDLGSGSGAARISLPQLDLAGANNSLAARLGGWPWDADLLGGTLAAQAELQWQTADATVVRGTASARLDGLAGYYGSNFFRGLAGVIDADIDTAAALPVATAPLMLTLAELDVGLPLRNLLLDLQLDRASQSLVVRSLYGEMLDGSFSASDQRFRFGSVDNAMTLQFAGLRLERLLELAEYEGVEAIGAVSGEVPLVFSAAGVQVAGGRLFAVQPGGSIRYLGAAGNGQGNAALDIMNRALSNYQFDTLESSIEYSPDGELVLSMQLQGRNPNMDNGRQVNLNLNISDNIPALLRSLQAGRAIEDFLEEQYQ